MGRMSESIACLQPGFGGASQGRGRGMAMAVLTLPGKGGPAGLNKERRGIGSRGQGYQLPKDLMWML